jgi:hypothetical protein
MAYIALDVDEAHHRRRDGRIYPSGWGCGTDEERSAFVDFIARNPEGGDVIPKSGGDRKVRWSRQREREARRCAGDLFLYRADVPLYLLMVYAKAQREDLSPDAKRAVQALAARIKRAHAPVRRREGS